MRYFEVQIEKDENKMLEKLTNEVNSYKELLSNISNDISNRDYYLKKYTETFDEYETLKRKVANKYIVPQLAENEIANWDLNFDTCTLVVTVRPDENMNNL